MTPTVLKHGIGYDLVVVQQPKKLVLAIRCHTCQRISFHPKDLYERYCVTPPAIALRGVVGIVRDAATQGAREHDYSSSMT